jgi:hypothetical protein
MGNMANQVAWSADKSLRNWMRDTRLDGFGKLTVNLSAHEAEKLATLADIIETSVIHDITTAKPASSRLQ